MNKPNLPKDVEYILTTLHNAKFEAFVVGGCVRDTILGIEPKDWDITTNALPYEVKKLFPKTFDTGIAHGTVSVVKNHVNYEITTYRIDGDYKDYRHPVEVSFTKNLIDDLLRRDFTMNAIAYNKTSGFQDPFKGIDDIKNKLIKGVGNPSKRFEEDALRMLRLIRFSAQLGFKPEEKTYLALKEKTALIQHISVERIREELEKLFLSPYLEQINLLLESGLLKEINTLFDQKLNKQNNDVFYLQLKNSPADSILRWTIVLQNFNENEIISLLKFLKFDNYRLKLISNLIKLKNEPLPNEKYLIKKSLNFYSIEVLEYLVKLKKILISNNDIEALKNIINFENLTEEIIKNNECYSLKTLEINGGDLISLGIKPGNEMGKILNELLDLVMREPCKNEKGLLIELVKNHIV